MLRAAAKNHAGVAVLVDPADYPALLDELKANGGRVSAATRFALAQEGLHPHRRLRRRHQQLSDRPRAEQNEPATSRSG